MAVILLQKKYGIIWELFPKGGGVPYSQNFELIYQHGFGIPAKNDFFLKKQKCSLGSKMQNKH